MRKMKASLFKIITFFAVAFPVFGQNADTEIVKTIVTNYYKNEKPVYKGRSQLLYFYCEKSNNNEEIFETINKMKLPPETVQQIRHEVTTDTAPENWSADLETIYTTDKSNLKQKINGCISVEQYQEQRKKLNLNNQRLMIVSKPIVYANGNSALVKVVFYRTIEHNNGSVLLLEKVNNNWVIKEYLNPWST